MQEFINILWNIMAILFVGQIREKLTGTQIMALHEKQ